ncbi:MAG: pantoate--beta-alanine ligase [Heliobacteriaceae bacterium]|nr:pantoate--beta-alanine ligase [Heliobacteriaceae bacterium]
MLAHTIKEVREQVKKWKQEGLSVGLVPTMGALHAGHLSLVEASVGKCDKTVVSVFVNPAQFGPNEDFDKYPRTLEEDVRMLSGRDVLIFAPSAEEMYPSSELAKQVPLPAQGESVDFALIRHCEEGVSPMRQSSKSTALTGLLRRLLCKLLAMTKQHKMDNSPQNNAVSFNLSTFLSSTFVVPPRFYTDKLCGKSRPGHFDGVCTVVAKLFNIVQPDYAFFGEKDRQQLIIIQKMVKDLNIPVEIIACPIVRGENGLALSSRNKYLKNKEEALVLNKVLLNIKACYDNGIVDVESLTETAYSFLNKNHSLEYLEFRDKDDLEIKKIADGNTIVFIAVKIGEVRLIDNLLLESS